MLAVYSRGGGSKPRMVSLPLDLADRLRRGQNYTIIKERVWKGSGETRSVQLHHHHPIHWQAQYEYQAGNIWQSREEDTRRGPVLFPARR